jgi:hypothetical protein
VIFGPVRCRGFSTKLSPQSGAADGKSKTYAPSAVGAPSERAGCAAPDGISGPGRKLSDRTRHFDVIRGRTIFPGADDADRCGVARGRPHCERRKKHVPLGGGAADRPGHCADPVQAHPHRPGGKTCPAPRLEDMRPSGDEFRPEVVRRRGNRAQATPIPPVKRT